MGIWERDEGIRTAVEAGLGELAAEVRAGRHPAELAGARLELLTVSPAARGWAGAGAVPCGTVLLPGTAGPLARALNARQAVSYGTSPRDTLTFSSLEGDRLCLAVQRELVTLGGAVVEQQSWCSPSLPAPPPCPFWPPRALCCSWVCRRRSCRRGSASRREACKTAPEPSGSGAVSMSLHLILTALAPGWLQTGLPCNRRRAAPGPPPPTGAGWWRSRWRT